VHIVGRFSDPFDYWVSPEISFSIFSSSCLFY